MPRCYMVKKQCNKYQPGVRDCWSQTAAAAEDPPGPVSPTEACVAPPYYSPGPTDTHTDTARPSYLQEFITPAAQEATSVEPSGVSVTQEHVLPTASSDGDIPIFRVRSVEETEAAHDLLSLSQSLPPLTAPGVVTIYQPAALYAEPYSPPLYQPPGLEAGAPTYRTASPLPVTIPCYQPQVLYVVQPQHLPTPPVSECSSDVENNQPALPEQPAPPDQPAPAPATDTAPPAHNTCDKLAAGADGRSKRAAAKKKITLRLEPLEEDDGEILPGAGDSEEDRAKGGKVNKYVCSECGKQYATSSNLSRHKQTHRSLDSQSAKKCMTCGKAYVSMPALAMHVLTHKLAHVCGVCGKMFSRPWLLQGHLRSHTGEKPYGCAHCGKAFADRSNLRAHMQTHSADKNFECPRCRKSFALKSYLNKHLESACQRDDEDEPEPDDPGALADEQ